MLRLWNADVDPAKTKLCLPGARRADALYKCDLLERAGKKRIPITSDGEAVVTLKPNEIATFLLRDS